MIYPATPRTVIVFVTHFERYSISIVHVVDIPLNVVEEVVPWFSRYEFRLSPTPLNR